MAARPAGPPLTDAIIIVTESCALCPFIVTGMSDDAVAAGVWEHYTAIHLPETYKRGTLHATRTDT